MPKVLFRPARQEDLPLLRDIMVEAFTGVSIDQAIEETFGVINGRDWQWRKGRHLEEDWRRDPEGIVVAERDGTVLGFISTWLDREAGIGHIPNISLVPECRGEGIGRQLLELALQRFRAAGLTHAKIETLAHNARGLHLYQSVGFREVVRQVHLAMDLNAPAPADMSATGLDRRTATVSVSCFLQGWSR
jgi:ribosomal protein S18 acetylase RimI-like enzyme